MIPRVGIKYAVLLSGINAENKAITIADRHFDVKKKLLIYFLKMFLAASYEP